MWTKETHNKDINSDLLRYKSSHSSGSMRRHVSLSDALKNSEQQLAVEEEPSASSRYVIGQGTEMGGLWTTSSTWESKQHASSSSDALCSS